MCGNAKCEAFHSQLAYSRQHGDYVVFDDDDCPCRCHVVADVVEMLSE